MEHVRANGSEQVRRVIDRLKPGRFVQKMDFRGEIHAGIDVDTNARAATIGLTGTSAEHITNSRLTDPEILESRYPVLIDAFRVRRGSGDRGRWSGGDGVVRRIRFRESMVVAVLANSPVIAPFGREGGNPGIIGKTYIQRADRETENLGSCGQREVRPSDAIVIETPGGGGFGARQ